MADGPKERKKTSGKGPGRNTTGRLNFMIRDLKRMKAELLPDEVEELGSIDITNADDFQRTKAMLTKHLSQLTADITEMNEIKKKRGGVRDAQLIGLQNENYKGLKTAENMWIKLKDAVEKNIKKGKLDQKTLDDRKKFVELFGKELIKLQGLNSGIKAQPNQEVTSKAIEQNRKRAAARAAKRQGRRQKREAMRGTAGAGGNDIEMEDLDKSQPIGAQEQQFYLEVQENDKKMDDLLDVVSAGLKELKEIATDIGTNLDAQKVMLEEVDEKMEATIENFQTANARLRELLDENTGGIETWCPIIILIIVLLAIVGYLFSIIP